MGKSICPYCGHEQNFDLSATSIFKGPVFTGKEAVTSTFKGPQFTAKEPSFGSKPKKPSQNMVPVQCKKCNREYDVPVDKAA